jgi:hypothetical protein
MSASKPTIEEQIAALATLRSFAARTKSWTAMPVAQDAGAAFDVLDNADVFRALDEESLERQVNGG